MKSSDYRKLIVSFSLIGSFLVFLSVINFATILLYFISVGEVPGTNYIVPADGMFAILLSIALIGGTPIVLALYSDIRKVQTPTKRTNKRTPRRMAKA